MPYKNNQLRGITKTFQDDTKVILSSSLAIDSHLKAKLRKEY